MCGQRLNGTEQTDRLRLAINHAQECSVLLDRWAALLDLDVDTPDGETRALLSDSIVGRTLCRRG